LLIVYEAEVRPEGDDAKPGVPLETVMPKRVVSKQTKLLFIGFGAASIAAACIVAAVDMNGDEGSAPKSGTAVVRAAAPVQPAK
jgi:hypothetical protein